MNNQNNSQNMGMPMPIVNFNRALLVGGVIIGLIFQQPLMTTFLLVINLLALLFGKQANFSFILGRRLFARQIPTAEREDTRLVRFNNMLAVAMLMFAQIGFLFGIPLMGWVFSLMVATAAGVALAGFCVGCYLYYQFKLQRYKFFGHQ